MLCRGTWSISSVLPKTCSSHPGVLVNFGDSKINASRSNCITPKWIASCRKSVGRCGSNEASWPETTIFVVNLPELSGNDNTARWLSQKLMLWKECQQWGPSLPVEDNLGSPSTRTWMVGLALRDQHGDDLSALTSSRAKKRENTDTYSSDKKSVHEKLALVLCNRVVVVTNPCGWEEAPLRKSNNNNIDFSD